jgi:spore germination cell wall hydrolase CwlJ-like protein
MNFVKPALAVALLTLTIPLGISTFIKLKPKPVDPQEVACLAKNIYHEARGEPLRGQVAVAQVTLNRLNNGSFGNSICEVVYAKKQFSWTLKPNKILDEQAWEVAVKIAKAVLDNTMHIPELTALYFHATYVKPRWAKQKQKVTTIGKHIFYN